jgi:hypothetical protein
MNGNIAHLATLHTNTDVHTLYGTENFTFRSRLVRTLDSRFAVGWYLVQISAVLPGILTFASTIFLSAYRQILS